MFAEFEIYTQLNEACIRSVFLKIEDIAYIYDVILIDGTPETRIVMKNGDTFRMRDAFQDVVKYIRNVTEK